MARAADVQAAKLRWRYVLECLCKIAPLDSGRSKAHGALRCQLVRAASRVSAPRCLKASGLTQADEVSPDKAAGERGESRRKTLLRHIRIVRVVAVREWHTPQECGKDCCALAGERPTNEIALHAA